MSDITIRDITRNQLSADRDVRKIFIGYNRFVSATFVNATGAELELLPGTVVGRFVSGVNAGKVAAVAVGDTDGLAIVLGVVKSCVTIADTEEAQVTVCVAGDVDSAKLILPGVETLSTVSGDKTWGDQLLSETMGIFPVDSDELSEFGN